MASPIRSGARRVAARRCVRTRPGRGEGAALWARKHSGAICGRGVRRQGNAYAIPTKDRQLGVLSLDTIRGHVRTFLDYAAGRADLRFQVTPIGCGLAGYRPEQIAPLFADAPANVILPEAFCSVLDAKPPSDAA